MRTKIIIQFIAVLQFVLLPTSEAGLFRRSHGARYVPTSHRVMTNTMVPTRGRLLGRRFGRRIVFFPRLRAVLFGGRLFANPSYGSGNQNPHGGDGSFDGPRFEDPGSEPGTIDNDDLAPNFSSPDSYAETPRKPKAPKGGTSPNSLSKQQIYYGASHLDPQTIAQARADEMARTGNFSHLGGGFVATTAGRLAEGIGWGQGMFPSTCVATNGTRALADAHARGRDGSIYRVRLYNSPGTTSC